MPNYDGIQTSYKLGNDLQIGPVDGDIRLWPTDEGGGTSDSGPLISICIHRGSLFVAWCEAWQDTSLVTVEQVVYGPFVKRYDPASNTWIQIGDVEPDLLPVDQNDRATWNAIASTYDVGTRFLPKLPRLASDGSSLYCVYAIHETVAGAGSTFSPFKLAVRRWTGFEWELYGEIPAVGWNDHGDGVFGGNFSGFSCISAAASPHDPGACYVTLVQSGEYAGGSSSSSDFLGEGAVVRFDGSTLAGDVRVIGTPRSAPEEPATTGFVSLEVRYDDEDGPWIWFRGGGDPFAFSQGVFLLRWSDMATVQSWDETVVPQVAPPVGYEPGAWLCPTALHFAFPSITDYFQTIRLIISDGSSSTSDRLDGLPDLLYPPADLSLDADTRRPNFVKLHAEPPHNIWAITAETGAHNDEGAIWLYHRPCRAWSRMNFRPVASDPYSGLSPSLWYLAFQQEGGRNLVLATAPTASGPGIDTVLNDGVLYSAVWVTDIVESETKVRVYASPIRRNINSCRTRGVETLPYFIPLGNQPAS